MKFKLSMIIVLLLLIMPIISMAQDNKEENKTGDTNGNADAEKDKKIKEENVFNELIMLVKKTLSEQMSSEERDELFKQIDEKSYEYYKYYAWMSVDKTQRAIMYRVTVLLYKNRREDFLVFSEEVLSDKKLPDAVRQQIFRERVEILRTLKKYDVLIKEIDEIIELIKADSENIDRVKLHSYLHLKLLCFIETDKSGDEFNKLVAEVVTNLNGIDIFSYKFALSMSIVRDLIQNNKAQSALSFINPLIKDIEKIKEQDDDTLSKHVQCLFFLGKIKVIENAPKEEIEEIKKKMLDSAKGIKSYRLRTPANNLVKELTSFMQFRVGIEAPNWKLKSIMDDKEVNLSDYKGKIVIIGFWATWNASSRNIMESYFKKWNEAYSKKEVVFINIGVSWFSDTALKQKEYVQENKYDWTFLIDNDDKVTEAYGVYEVPKVVVVGTNGKVQFLGLKLEEIDQFLKEQFKDDSEKPQTQPGK